jgi:hypothetical protein
VPAGHALQADTSETPDMLLNVAGGHGVQDVMEAAATVSLYVPDGQFLHSLEPGVSLNVPLAHGAQLTELPSTEDCKYPGSHRIGGNATPLCIAAPTPLLPNVDIMTLGDAGAAAGLRKPEIWHSQGIAELMGVAPPAGNLKDNTRTALIVSKVTTNAPENWRLVHEAPDCSSLRAPEVPTKSTKARPVTLSAKMIEVGVNATETETFRAFAMDEETWTEEPLITEEKIGGNDPWELAAITSPNPFRIAALIETAGRALLDWVKVPNVNESSAFDNNSALKTNSSAGGIWREKEITGRGKFGVVTFTNGGCENAISGCPTRVMTSLEPEDTATAGRKDIVIVTPATDTMEFDKVICVKACQMPINAKQNNAYPRLLWS